MRLYLGSYRIADPDSLKILLGHELEGTKTAVIGNAKDAKSTSDRAVSLGKVHKSLGALGLNTEEIDLRNMSNAKACKEELSSFEISFITGGNSFVLRESMRISGFDEAAHDLVDTGLIYCGESAGAVVAGSVIASADEKDIHEVPQPIFEGLGLTNRIIVPHANWSERAEYIKYMTRLYGDRILTLADDQAFIVKQ